MPTLEEYQAMLDKGQQHLKEYNSRTDLRNFFSDNPEDIDECSNRPLKLLPMSMRPAGMR